MTVPTPFLSTLVLLSSAFPAQVFRLAAGTDEARVRRGFARVAAPLVAPVLFAGVAALVWYLAPVSGVLGGLPQRTWYYVAAGAGLLAPALEILVGFVIARLRRTRVARIVPHERWSRFSVAALLTVVVMAAGEELVFRGVWTRMLEHVAGWPVAAAIGLTAVVYGFNHLYFGWLTVAQKVVSGVAFGVLLELCHGNLIVPVIAHVTQNIVVVAILPLLTRRR
jgi:membrane protease YdiL (CAAX protease family)